MVASSKSERRLDRVRPHEKLLMNCVIILKDCEARLVDGTSNGMEHTHRIVFSPNNKLLAIITRSHVRRSRNQFIIISLH